MADIFDEAISKHIIEVRFKSSGSFLDKKGDTADRIVESSNIFKTWNISEFRIDFSCETNPNIKAFIGFRNFGLISTSPNKTDYFLQNAENFIKLLWPLLPNYDFPRVGIRSMFLIKNNDFEAMLAGYKKRFLKLNNDELNGFGDELLDLSFPMDFKNGQDYFNVLTGPMRKEQFKKYLGEIESESSGIFTDVDFFRKNLHLDKKQKELLELLQNGVKKAQDIANLVSSWVVETE